MGEEGAGRGGAFTLRASLKPGRGPQQSEPLGEADVLTSPLALGLFLSRATAAATACSIHAALPGPLQAGGHGRKGVPLLHQRACPSTTGKSTPAPAHTLESRLLDPLVLSLLLPPLCEWSSKEPQEKG